jgi:hypothetical protein
MKSSSRTLSPLKTRSRSRSRSRSPVKECSATEGSIDLNKTSAVPETVVKTISPQKRRFLRLISPGIRVLMTCSWRSDEIAATNYDDDITDDLEKAEKYIKDNLLRFEKSGIGVYRYWFCELKFDAMVENGDYDTVKCVFHYIDEFFNIKQVLYESCCVDEMDEMNEGELLIASKIENREIGCFEEFLEYEA